MRRWRTRATLAFAGAAVVVSSGSGWGTVRQGPPAASSKQALRICVDRWNQDRMVSWSSMFVRISIRGLSRRERSVLAIPDPTLRRCTVSLAGRRGANSWICLIGETGGYDCPLVTSDGMPPLRDANGTTDRRGVLKLDVPLTGTRATRRLLWQRRYPHADGFIVPWTRAATLRAGLRFVGTERGPCGRWVEHRVPPSAVRCVDARTQAYTDSCFPQRRNFRAGDLAACSAPGDLTFTRWRITGRL